MPNELILQMLSEKKKKGEPKPSSELVSFVPAEHSRQFNSFSRTIKYSSLSCDETLSLIERAQHAFQAEAKTAVQKDGSVLHNFSAKDFEGGHCGYSIKAVPKGEGYAVSASLLVATKDKSAAGMLREVADHLLHHATFRALREKPKVYKKPISLFNHAKRKEHFNYAVEYH